MKPIVVKITVFGKRVYESSNAARQRKSFYLGYCTDIKWWGSIEAKLKIFCRWQMTKLCLSQRYSLIVQRPSQLSPGKKSEKIKLIVKEKAAMNWHETDRNRIIIADIIAKAWQDLQLKEDFITEPKKVLKAAGIDDLPDEVELRVIENTSNRQYVVLPAEFSSEEYNDFTASMQSLLPIEAGKEIVLVQDTATLQHISLPNYNEQNGVLSEEELELVSGGKPIVILTQGLVITRTLVLTSSKSLIPRRAPLRPGINSPVPPWSKK